MPSGNAIASGSVVLTANADQMAKDLQGANQKVKHWAQHLRSDLGKDFAQEMGRRSFLGGVLGGLVGGGLGGAVSEIIANTMAAVAEKVSESVLGFKELKQDSAAVAQSIELTDRLMSRVLEKSSEWRAALVNPADIASSIDETMKTLNQTIVDSRSQLNETRNKLRDAEDPSFAGYARYLFGKEEEYHDKITDNMNKQSAAVRKLMDNYDKLKEAKERAIDPKKDPAKVGQINRELARMNDEIIKLGMTDTEAKLFDLEKLGLDEHGLRNALDMLTLIEEKKRQIDYMAKVPIGLPAFSPMLSIIGEVAEAMPKQSTLGDLIRNSLKSDSTQLSGAIEAGTAEGYSLAVRNKYGGIEGGGQDVHKQNGQKLDAVRGEIRDAARGIMEALRGIGVL